MKKNKIMRIASVLLIVTLLSTCAISGTFAKYVVTGEAEGYARVAKWGVTVTVEGEVASREYATDDDTFAPVNGSNAVTVKARDLVVAPGTGSTDDANYIEATVTGKPEVATRFQLFLDENNFTEICLPAGTYRDWTSADPDDTFTIEEDYKPVLLTLSFERDGRQVGPFTGTVQDIIDALNDIGGRDDLSADFVPGSNVFAKIRLTWAWPFEVGADAPELAGDCTNDATTIRDKADTFLGNAIAVELGQDIEDFEMPDDIVLEESFNVTASATQID